MLKQVFRRMLCQGAGLQFEQWRPNADKYIEQLLLHLCHIAGNLKVPGCTLKFRSYLQADLVQQVLESHQLRCWRHENQYGYSCVEVRWSEFLGDKVDSVFLVVAPDWQFNIETKDDSGLDANAVLKPMPREMQEAFVNARLEAAKANNG